MEKKMPATLSEYRIKTPESDYYLFSCEAFSPADQTQLSSLEAYAIPIQTKSHKYSLNCRLLPSLPSSAVLPVLALHGHGPSCTWATWLKLALILNRAGHTVLMIDMPGFGGSTVDGRTRTNSKIYVNDAPELLACLLKRFSLGKTHAVGFCGGAATFLRAIAARPELFAQQHVMHNCVVGAVPEKLLEVCKANGMKIWCSWREDRDHQRCCVGYKLFAKMRKEKSAHIGLEDIGEKDLPCMCAWAKGMGCGTDKVEIFDVSEWYGKFVADFFAGCELCDFKTGSGEAKTKVEDEKHA